MKTLPVLLVGLAFAVSARAVPVLAVEFIQHNTTYELHVLLSDSAVGKFFVNDLPMGGEGVGFNATGTLTPLPMQFQLGTNSIYAMIGTERIDGAPFFITEPDPNIPPTSVPDGGATVALLLVGIVALAIAHKPLGRQPEPEL